MSDIKQALLYTEDFIPSPLNYIGNKFKLLKQIMPLFPKNINTAIDLFCGGASVGINLKAKNIILNDNLSELIRLYENLQTHNIEIIFKKIFHIIEHFKLSHTAQMGYDFYECSSSKGLATYNKDKFLQLRNRYNQSKNIFDFFVLVIFAFNNQIRFNSKGEFNLPCGKRDFNANMQKKLRQFVLNLQIKNIKISNKDFRDFNLSSLDSKDFVYVDPPYFLATAPYNENKAWTLQDELDLLEFLTLLQAKNIRFALSNVILHKGKEHSILEDWLKKHSNLKTHFLNFHYKNCNYQTKKALSQEVLITNY